MSVRNFSLGIVSGVAPGPDSRTHGSSNCVYEVLCAGFRTHHRETKRLHRITGIYTIIVTFVLINK